MSRTLPYKRKAKSDNNGMSKKVKVESYIQRIGRLSVRSRELKMTDGAATGDLATLALTTPTLLNGIAAGDDVNQRDGRRIALHSIQLKGQIYNDDDVKCSARVVVVYDRQSNSTALTPGVYFSNTANYASFSNLNNQGRFITLFDQQYAMDASGSGNSIQSLEMFKYLSGLPVHFSGNNNDIGSIDMGSIYLYVFTSVTNAGGCNIVTRIKYRDL